MNTCCFTGHRPQNLPCGFNEKHIICLRIKSQLRRLIAGVIEKRIQRGLYQDLHWVRIYGQQRLCLN